MYVRHEGSGVMRHWKSWRGSGASPSIQVRHGTAELELPAEQLRCWDEEKHQWVLEPDKVRAMVGTASNDVKLTKTIEVRTKSHSR